MSTTEKECAQLCSSAMCIPMWCTWCISILTIEVAIGLDAIAAVLLLFFSLSIFCAVRLHMTCNMECGLGNEQVMPNIACATFCSFFTFPLPVLGEIGREIHGREALIHLVECDRRWNDGTNEQKILKSVINYIRWMPGCWFHHYYKCFIFCIILFSCLMNAVSSTARMHVSAEKWGRHSSPRWW